MKPNNMLKKFKVYLERQIGSKLNQNMKGQNEFNNKLKRLKNSFNLGEDNC